MNSTSTTSTTVRFLNGDLITYPDISSDNSEDLIDAICENYPTPIHPLQVALYRDEDDENIKNIKNINALIFPKKRVVLNEFEHVFVNMYLNNVDWEGVGLGGIVDFDLDRMTNESILRHILSLPVGEIPTRVFSNPADVVVDFLHTSGIFRLDQTSTEINEWFSSNIETHRGRQIFSNPSNRIADVMAGVDVNSLFEKYQAWAPWDHDDEYKLTTTVASLIMVHPQATNEMIGIVVEDAISYPDLTDYSYRKKDEENTWRFLAKHRFYKYYKNGKLQKLHPDLLTTLTEVLHSLQYADCEIVFE